MDYTEIDLSVVHKEEVDGERLERMLADTMPTEAVSHIRIATVSQLNQGEI